MANGFNISLIDVTQKSVAFDSIAAAIDFSKKEIAFWKDEIPSRLSDMGVKPRNNILNNAINSNNSFFGLLRKLEALLPTFDSLDDASSRRALQDIGQDIAAIRNNWINSEHPFIWSWLECFKVSDQTADAFWEAVVQNQSSQTGRYDYLKGYLLAYEYSLQGNSDLTKRRKSEEKAFDRMRSQLFSKKNELVEDVVEFKKDIIQWADETKTNFSNWHDEQKRISGEELEAQVENFGLKMQGWEEKIESLEKTFVEKLRFNGPATYWKKQSEKYRCQGIIWTMALMAVVAFALVYFREFFLLWANGQRLQLNLASLEGAVIFTAILSSFVFLSRIFSRLAFSSFHLQRDAEEREQLTHLYLALGHENEIDSESRVIILQALFSRSETGLIANESGPTMPGLSEAVTAAMKK